MVATVRCEEIANEKFNLLASDKVFVVFSLSHSFSCILLNFLHGRKNFSGLVGSGASGANWWCCRVWKNSELHIDNLFF